MGVRWEGQNGGQGRDRKHFKKWFAGLYLRGGSFSPLHF